MLSLLLVFYSAHIFLNNHSSKPFPSPPLPERQWRTRSHGKPALTVFLAPQLPPSCSACPQASPPCPPNLGFWSHRGQAWAAARLSHPDAGAGVGALPGAGLGASSTSGTHYQQWLPSGLLCLPLTYLPGDRRDGKRFSQLE